MDEARRLCQVQFRILLSREPGVRKGNRTALHDFRVAVRRLNAVFRAFRRLLEPTSARRIESEIRAFNKSIGPSRDLDVWLHYLKTHARKMGAGDLPGWETFLSRQESRKNRETGVLQRQVSGRAYAKLKADIVRLLREEMPAARRAMGAQPLSQWAGKAVQKAIAKIRERHAVCRQYTMEEAHALRIACRRARYLIEFFGNELGKSLKELGRRLKQVQSVLGRIHDLDVWISMLRRQKSRTAKQLRRNLCDKRAHELKRFHKAWTCLQHPSLQKKVQAQLRRHSPAPSTG